MTSAAASTYSSVTKKACAIVTGASPSSIGFLAARTLAGPKHDFFVILACRDPIKGLESERRIREFYQKNYYCHVKYMPLDLASRVSIRTFVEEVQRLPELKEMGGLSLLVNNAGIGWGLSTPYRRTEDGLEEVVGINHFGTFFLTQLLLEDLKRAAKKQGKQSRVVLVSSSLHAPTSLSSSPPPGGQDGESKDSLLLPAFPNGILQPEDETYSAAKAYRVSKLCNLWFTYELQQRLRLENVVVNAVSPGWIPATGLARQSGWLGTILLQYILDPWRHLGLGMTRSPEDGAEAIVQAATSPGDAAEGGKYFHLPKKSNSIVAIKSSAESYDMDKTKELWKISLQTCGLLE